MIESLIDFYKDVVENKSDHRVENLFLMSSPASTLMLCLVYLISVVVVAPFLMKNKKPLNLQKVITLYNVMQVFCNGYIFYECIAIGWLSRLSIFRCQSVDFSESRQAKREMMIMYLYFLSKFTEFADTIFFVLRKKTSQVTFLHVYHHVSMPLYIWMATKFYPGGSLTIIAFVNSIIHVVMYTYYLLAGLGPHMQQYLWWKKYLTVMQLIQFVTGTTHFVIVFFSGPDCNISRQFILMYVGMGIVFYILFSSFYKKSYRKTEENIEKSFKTVPWTDESIVKTNDIKVK